jgi:ABC-type phosphate transport system auxiliary subunit
VDGEQAKLLLHYCISSFCYIGKPAYLSMPKFLAGCHYNEEEISRHLKKKKKGYWPVQMNSNKFATGQILKKTGRSCEGADFSWLSSKVFRTLV